MTTIIQLPYVHYLFERERERFPTFLILYFIVHIKPHLILIKQDTFHLIRHNFFFEESKTNAWDNGNNGSICHFSKFIFNNNDKMKSIFNPVLANSNKFRYEVNVHVSFSFSKFENTEK